MAGWQVAGDTAISPIVRSPSDVPTDNSYDEWYVYEAAPALSAVEVFINYGAFSLRDPSEHSQTDAISRGSVEWLAWLRDAQNRFWNQLLRLNPESYLADGDNVICVTRSEQARIKLDALR